MNVVPGSPLIDYLTLHSKELTQKWDLLDLLLNSAWVIGRVFMLLGEMCLCFGIFVHFEDEFPG